ncbi:hypothetical protein MP228_009451 [Amoeboaphelidium protococcarum]|nr:hypothetical protein MP228_009451 [Amoeboaphelidium protococcarum]
MQHKGQFVVKFSIWSQAVCVVASQLSINQPDIDNLLLAAVCTLVSLIVLWLQYGDDKMNMQIAMRFKDKTFKINEAELTQEYGSYLKFVKFIDNFFADADMAAQASEMKYVHPLDFYSKDLEEEDDDENGATSAKAWHDGRNLGVFQSLLKQ